MGAAIAGMGREVVVVPRDVAGAAERAIADDGERIGQLVNVATEVDDWY